MCSTLTACVDDVITNADRGNPIGFTTSVNTHSRTSLIHTTENLDSFRIYAYCPDGLEFFHDLLVTKVDPDSIEANYYALNWMIEGGPYYPPDDFDFGLGGVGIDNGGQLSTACRDNWKALPGQDYADRYEIIPSQQCRLRDPGTMNSKKLWVGKKQGDTVLTKAIDFRVVVDEWNNRDIPVDMEDYYTSEQGHNKKK